MRRWPAILLLAAGVLFPGCGTVMASETMITFFYVLNTSGRDVRVRVSADGREPRRRRLEGRTPRAS